MVKAGSRGEDVWAHETTEKLATSPCYCNSTHTRASGEEVWALLSELHGKMVT